jgi:hypothetical protein
VDAGERSHARTIHGSIHKVQPNPFTPSEDVRCRVLPTVILEVIGQDESPLWDWRGPGVVDVEIGGIDGELLELSQVAEISGHLYRNTKLSGEGLPPDGASPLPMPPLVADTQSSQGQQWSCPRPINFFLTLPLKRLLETLRFCRAVRYPIPSGTSPLRRLSKACPTTATTTTLKQAPLRDAGLNDLDVHAPSTAPKHWAPDPSSAPQELEKLMLSETLSFAN